MAERNVTLDEAMPTPKTMSVEILRLEIIYVEAPSGSNGSGRQAVLLHYIILLIYIYMYEFCQESKPTDLPPINAAATDETAAAPSQVSLN